MYGHVLRGARLLRRTEKEKEEGEKDVFKIMEMLELKGDSFVRLKFV